MIQFLSISQNTFIQTIRQPIYVVVILAVFALLVLTLPLSGWTVSQDYHATDQQFLEILGLGTLGAAGLLLAAFSASSVLSREIEDKTALTVIAKPVSRSTFVMGKFAGVAVAVAIGFYLCSIVFLLTVRHKVMSAAADPYDWPVITLGLLALLLTTIIAIAGNLVFGWHMTSTAVWAGLVLFTVAFVAVLFVGKEWVLVSPGYDVIPKAYKPEPPVITLKLVTAVVLMFLAVMVLTGVAVASSTRLGMVMTLLVCFVVALLGSAHPKFQSLAREVPAAHVLTFLLPNLTYFFAVDAMADTSVQVIPLAVVGWYTLYAAVYIAGVLAVGIALFQSRELDSQEGSTSLSGAMGVLAWAGRVGAALSVVAGAALLSMLLRPDLPMSLKLQDLSLGLPLLVAGVASWMLWGYFARGRRWAYLVVATLLLVNLAYAIVMLTVPQVPRWLVPPGGIHSGGLMILQAILAVTGLIILALPHTRQHFGFIKRKTLAVTLMPAAPSHATVSNHD